jgi:hypothetical protein
MDFVSLFILIKILTAVQLSNWQRFFVKIRVSSCQAVKRIGFDLIQG